MSPKIPSEKSPDLVKEIQAEFSHLFEKEGQKAGFLIKANPRLVFISMVLLIILSGVVSFFLRPLESQFAQPEDELKVGVNHGADATSNELGLLLDLGGRAKRLYTLQEEIERLLSKEALNEEDSVFLDKALQELEYFENHKPKADEDQME